MASSLGKAAVQIGGFISLIAVLSTMKNLPNKEVKSNLSLCEASRLKEPTTVTVVGFVRSYEMSGVNSTLVVGSNDGCQLRVAAGQAVIGEALTYLGKADGYVSVTGQVKDGMISPKSNEAVSIRSISVECGVPVYGGWEETGVAGGVRGWTRSRFNPTPTTIGIKREVRFTIPQDGVWRVGCVENNSGISQVISVRDR